MIPAPIIAHIAGSKSRMPENKILVSASSLY
jgi:hypothetical protein